MGGGPQITLVGLAEDEACSLGAGLIGVNIADVVWVKKALVDDAWVHEGLLQEYGTEEALTGTVGQANVEFLAEEDADLIRVGGNWAVVEVSFEKDTKSAVLGNTVSVTVTVVGLGMYSVTVFV